MASSCLDTCALIEIAKGNAKFADLLNCEFVSADVTLAEFYGVILREHGQKIADFWLGRFYSYALPVEKDVLIEAIRFRYEHRKRGISFFDAVGYVFSLKSGLRFVTGDKEFERFKGAEFRKAA